MSDILHQQHTGQGRAYWEGVVRRRKDRWEAPLAEEEADITIEYWNAPLAREATVRIDRD